MSESTGRPPKGPSSRSPIRRITVEQLGILVLIITAGAGWMNLRDAISQNARQVREVRVDLKTDIETRFSQAREDSRDFRDEVRRLDTDLRTLNDTLSRIEDSIQEVQQRISDTQRDYRPPAVRPS